MELECPHCGYVWDYTGKLEMPTCPSCHRNIKAKINKTNGGEG